MTKYKNLEEKIDEALALSKESGKAHVFDICESGAEITATKVAEGDISSIENKCQGTKLGSFHVPPISKDVTPPLQPDVNTIQKPA